MDYDDNDFHNQTFQLVSEENNTKFPPGLRSYSLPKFDLDDNVNSRFDSLVGSEGLLGIQSQEENQWIEDFSGGSSGIEFSSTAAESCSISRRNNVWSEATSSESVEMLLKSVGQDEMIMGQTTTIIEGPVSGDGLGNLATQMGLQNSDKEGSVAPSKGLDAIDMDSALPTNLSKEAADKLQPLVEDVTGESEASAYGSLKDLGPSSVIETYCSTTVTMSGGDLFVDDDNCRKTNLESVPLVSSEGKNKARHECPPGFENMHLDSPAAPDPTHAEIVSEIFVSDCCDSLTANKKNYKSQGDASVLSDSSRSLVVCSSEAAETTSKVDGDALRVQTDDSSMETHVSSPGQIESSQSCERKIGGLEPSDKVIGHSDASLINKEIERSTVDPGSKVECDTDGSLSVGQKVSTSPSNQTIVIPERMVDETPSVQVLSEQSDVMKLACDNKLSGAKDLPEGSNIDAEPEEDAKAQLLVEKYAHSDKQEAVTTISLEPSSSSVVKVRSQMPDLSISPELREGEPSVDAGKISDAVGKPSSPLGHDSARCQNKPPTTVANKDALDSRDVLGTPVSYESLSKVNDGAQVVGVSFVEQEGAVMKSAGSYRKNLEKPMPSLEESSQDVDPKSVEDKRESGNDVQSVLIGEESGALNHSGDFHKPLMMLRDDADRQSMQTGSSNPNSIELRCGSPTVISCSEPSQSEKGNQLLGDAFNGSMDIFKPARMLKGDSELHPVQTGNINLNSFESNCGSPTVISCSEPSLSEKENLVLGKEVLEDQSNASVCEANIATSVLHDPKVKSCSQDDRNFTFEVVSQPHPSERTGDDWSPFPTDLPCASQIAQGSPPRNKSCLIDTKMLSHVTQGSPSTKTVDQINSKMSSHTSHGSPRKYGGRKARKSSKGHKPADDTAIAGREAPNDKASPLKNELFLSQKEFHEGKGGIDQGTNQFSSIPHDPSRVDLLKDDRSFTFKVTSHAPLVETEIGNGWKLQPNDVLQNFPKTVETSPIMSSFCQTDPNIIQDISFATTRTSGVKSERQRSRADGKARSGSGKVVDRVAAKEGKTFEEVTPRKQIKGSGGSSLGALSPSSFGAVNRVAPAEEMRPFGFIEGRNTKPSPVPTGHTSSLPDLNTSIPTSAIFQQPFTDSQQVQLRAQIFVYGSLIQGTTPDEPCMMSAFGESDGGRSMWENVWRVALERLQHQKSPLSSAKVPAQTTRGFLQSDAFSTPGRAGAVGAPPMMLSPVMSSPLWNVSSPCEGLYASSSSTRKGGPLMDPHQTIVQVHHPYQSPHLRHYIGSTNTWQSQAPAPATWVVGTPQSSSLSAPNPIHSAALPVSETVHVSSGREPSSVARTSGLVQKPALPPSTPAHVGSLTSASARAPSPILDVKITPPPFSQSVVESKPRKRRKGSASSEIDQISSFVQPTLAPEPVSSHGDGHQLLTTSVTPITSAPSNFDSNVSAGSSCVLATTLPTPPRPNFHVLSGHAETEQRGGIVLSEETSRQIDQAQRQAEEASSLAATAVKHSQSVWTQLAIQRSSGLVSDVEAKLASAAVTIAAAAAVAKAAASAAKIASDAAVQAKLMADEVLVFPGTLGNMTSDACLYGGVKNMGNFVSPTSILKDKDRTNNSDLILVAAREAAKKRVEAASAATRRAENLDAVVKAAGMAAEAVSQASTIIAIGDPVPFTLQELVEAGSENYWKVQQHHMFSDQTTSMAQQPEVVCADEGVTRCTEHHLKETEGTPDQGKKVLPPQELSKQVENNNLLACGMLWGPAGNGEKGLVEPKPGRSSDFAESIGSAAESQIGSICALQNGQSEEYGAAQKSARTSTENLIEEGSVVEVLSCEEALGRRVWLPAKVLNLKDGKAYVCYTELAGGSGQPTEWMPLDGEGGQAPRIRIPHLVSSLKYEGTRKRRRAARGDCSWSIGDKVDAWINNGWWEGTITEKGKDNETNLTVQLSAQGDASIVGSWNLRPSLIWRDGHWMEWSRLTKNIVSSHEGDTPREKRTKLGPRVAETDAGIEVRETDKIAKHKVHTEESEKPEASRPLPPSVKETLFNIGKNSKEDNKCKFGMKRIGLQKQGSSVVPGRKKKFMDVSKQYVSNRGVTATTEANNSIKFTKFLIPQDSAPRGWKNPSKVVSRGKRVAESRPNFHKSGNPNSVMGINTSERDSQSSSVSVPSATGVGIAHNLIPNTQASITKNDGNMSGCVSDAPSLKQKTTSTVATVSVNKREHAATPGQRFSRNEEKDRIGHNEKSVIPDAVEPRRSVRRIQPTYRLLEGLQSSLIVSKIPNAHDRGTKGQHRGAAASKGSNNG